MADGERIERWIRAGIDHHRAGRLDEAERLYQRVLRRDPSNADACHYLGVLAHQRGDAATGTDLIRKALALEPDYPDAYNNLGRILSETGLHAEAIEAFREALRRRPGLTDARYNLVVCLRKSGRADEAVAEIEQTIADGIADAKTYYQLALAHAGTERTDAACDALVNALERDPTMTKAYERLGMLLYGLGRIDEAAGVYARWLDVEPTSAKARHLKSACDGVDVPDRAASEYVVDVFDSFAGTFDEKLAKLDYRAPALVADAVGGLGLPPRGADVLDAGCGTGLCGPLLAPWAKSLIGVDLSTGMIAKARALGVYDRLEVGELVDQMKARAASFDLIVSADTLVYFGRLEGVLTAAAGALRPGGALVFTLEAAPQGAGPFLLNPHGRYSHASGYVEAAVEHARLRLERLDSAVLRFENRQPVEGLVAVARL